MFRFIKECGYTDPHVFGVMQREGMGLASHMAGYRGEGL